MKTTHGAGVRYGAFVFCVTAVLWTTPGLTAQNAGPAEKTATSAAGPKAGAKSRRCL